MSALGQAPPMTHLRLSSVALLLSACASVHGPSEPPPPDPIEPIEPIPGVVIIAPPITRVTPLEQCLDDGGALTLVASVNNDDITEHGSIASLAVDAAGTLAVASSD